MKDVKDMSALYETTVTEEEASLQRPVLPAGSHDVSIGIADVAHRSIAAIVGVPVQRSHLIFSTSYLSSTRVSRRSPPRRACPRRSGSWPRLASLMLSGTCQTTRRS